MTFVLVVVDAGTFFGRATARGAPSSTPCVTSSLSGGTYDYVPKQPIVLNGTGNAKTAPKVNKTADNFIGIDVAYGGNADLPPRWSSRMAARPRSWPRSARVGRERRWVPSNLACTSCR